MRRNVGLWLLIAALALAGCGATRTDANGVPMGMQVGQALPDAEFTTFAGEKVRLHELRGRPVVLNFWATWCGPCKAEIPMLQAAYAATDRTGFHLLAVTEERESVVRDFIAAEGMVFPVLFDVGGRALARYGVQAIPTTIFIDADGVIAARHTGVLTSELIQAYLAQIMIAPADAPPANPAPAQPIPDAPAPAPRPPNDGVGAVRWLRPEL
jgi:peroxiredoxin